MIGNTFYHLLNTSHYFNFYFTLGKGKLNTLLQQSQSSRSTMRNGTQCYLFPDKLNIFLLLHKLSKRNHFCYDFDACYDGDCGRALKR